MEMGVLCQHTSWAGEGRCAAWRTAQYQQVLTSLYGAKIGTRRRQCPPPSLLDATDRLSLLFGPEPPDTSCACLWRIPAL